MVSEFSTLKNMSHNADNHPPFLKKKKNLGLNQQVTNNFWLKESIASKSYVFMFPWLAFGHMLPFLELSKQLAAKGIHVSFIATPRNIKRLPNIPQHITNKIKLVQIQFPIVDGLPENCEATIDLQREHIQ